jgi:tripartite-type tricarboxylate transporter receptor subunit TctC
MNLRITFGIIAALIGAPALAQDYPSKPIRMIVPFPAGGTADALPRIVAERLRTVFPQGVVIENRPGAGGNIGAEHVFRAEPDGYTLLASPPGPLAVNQSLYKKLAFDSTKFVPISLLATIPTVLVVNNQFGTVSLADFIAQLRANPDKFSAATQGNGSTSHLTAYMFQAATGTRLTHVPYKGTAPALTDLMGGQVTLFFDNLSSSIGPQRGGKVAILAVADQRRSPVIPNVPTFTELGWPMLQSASWVAIAAPPGTPDAIAQRLNTAIVEIVKSADVRNRYLELGAEPIGASRDATAKFFADEAQKWRRVITDANVTLD